ncbi:OmpP1/FadL family transporter [Bremerella cremea]|nr:outer membrane protein transport protein [Bremerella cremea]
MKNTFGLLLATAAIAFAATEAYGQSFGVELQNTIMPASGGMGGTSIARPQDLTSAINGNPASLTQFQGTQFLFGGGWVEPTITMDQQGNIPAIGTPLVSPFSGKSTAPGTPLGNIGVTQDFRELGLPVTLGIGFVTTAGGFVDYRNFPESNGTNTEITIFNLPIMLGVDVTDKLSIGAGMSLGIAFFDGPFVGASGMTADYALRGTIGANYQLNACNTLGMYYQTEQSFQFDNGVLINPGLNQTAYDVRMDLPQNFGFGVANTALMGGDLLLAADVTYKMWDEAAMYSAVYDNQWVVQLGAQYSLGKYRLRAGYTWAENPIDNSPGGTVGGVPLADLRSVRYTQGLLAVTSQHRISAGIGVVDVLPGIDFDLMAGGMLKDTQQLGNFTTTSIQSYWLGAGITWRFGRGACCQRIPAPDSWSTY